MSDWGLGFVSQPRPGTCDFDCELRANDESHYGRNQTPASREKCLAVTIFTSRLNSRMMLSLGTLITKAVLSVERLQGGEAGPSWLPQSGLTDTWLGSLALDLVGGV